MFTTHKSRGHCQHCPGVESPSKRQQPRPLPCGEGKCGPYHEGRGKWEGGAERVHQPAPKLVPVSSDTEIPLGKEGRGEAPERASASTTAGASVQQQEETPCGRERKGKRKAETPPGVKTTTSLARPTRSHRGLPVGQERGGRKEPPRMDPRPQECGKALIAAATDERACYCG